MSFVIAIEGNDGAGKSTIIKLLKRYYNSIGYKVIVVRYNMSFVTLPAIKEGKKRHFSGEVNSYLHYISVLDQIERFLSKKRYDNHIIIWDRYKYSIIARGMGRSVNSEILNHINTMLPNTDLTFFLDILPEESIKRLGSNINYWEAGKDVYPDLNKEEAFMKFQNEVRKNFFNIIPQKELQIIDAKMSIIENFYKIVEIVNCYINIERNEF